MVGLSPPVPLADQHTVDSFSSGVDTLDDWLKRRARSNQAAGASRTYVVAEGARVVAYYAVASGEIAAVDALGRFRRNMPNPIPVVLLGRLAIDKGWSGKGLGRALVRDCALRVAHAADVIGIRGIVVHAISDDAKRFYEAVGFESSPADPLRLMITLQDIRAVLGGDGTH